MERRRLTRTQHPGIYTRGSSFIVVWRDAGGKQHKTYRPSLDDAIGTQRELRGEVAKARMQTAAARAKTNKRVTSDVAAGYSQLRKALQVVDSAHSQARGAKRELLDTALARLHAAEDAVVRVMRQAS